MPFTSERIRQRAEWALIAGHLLVLGALMFVTRPWITADSPRYLALAKSLELGRGFGLGVGAAFEPEGMRLPGYPAFLAACHLIFGDDNLGVVIVQGVLFIISVVVIFKVVKETFGPSAGLAFLVISLVYPFVAFSACQISAEMPAVFLCAMALFCLLRPSLLRFVIAGVLIGLAGYVRPNLLPLTVAMAIGCCLANRQLWRGTLAMVVVSGAVAMPWAVRNYSQLQVFTPMPAFSGAPSSLLLATWQARVSTPALLRYGMTGEVVPELAASGLMEQFRSINEQLGVRADTLVSLENYPGNDRKRRAVRLFQEAAIANMKAWPGRYLASTAWNVPRVWFSAFLPTSIPRWLALVLVAEGVLVVIAGVVGLVMALRRRQPERTPAVAAAMGAIAFFAVALPWLHTEARFTIPVRLFLLVFASYAALELGRALLAVLRRRLRMHSTEPERA